MVWRRQTLSNDLRVLLLPRQSANTAQLSIAVEYGSNQEPKEIAGSAHFLEHMLAGGSTNRIKLSRSVENSGGVLDFFTEHEYMMSTMDILPEKLLEAASVISKLLFGRDFEEEKFKQERKIILNELAETSDEPTIKVEELLLKSLFKNHPVKRPIGGSPKTIKKLTLNQLINAHRLNYIAQNMILILTGNFSEKNSNTILKNFEKRTFEKTVSIKTNLIEDTKPKPLVVETKAGIAQTYLCLGARAVCSTHKDAPTLDLINALLGGGTSSRLFIELREKNAFTYDINSNLNIGVDFGYFKINCAVKGKNLAKTKKLILRELCKLRTEKIAIEELKRGKNLIIADILRGMDNSRDCSDILAYMEVQFKSERSLVDYINKIKAVSSEDILAAAKSYLQADRFSTVVLNPAK